MPGREPSRHHWRRRGTRSEGEGACVVIECALAIPVSGVAEDEIRRPPVDRGLLFFPEGWPSGKAAVCYAVVRVTPCASSNLAPSALSRDAGASGGLINRCRQVRFLRSARLRGAVGERAGLRTRRSQVRVLPEIRPSWCSGLHARLWSWKCRFDPDRGPLRPEIVQVLAPDCVALGRSWKSFPACTAPL